MLRCCNLDRCCSHTHTYTASVQPVEEGPCRRLQSSSRPPARPVHFWWQCPHLHSGRLPPSALPTLPPSRSSDPILTLCYFLLSTTSNDRFTESGNTHGTNYDGSARTAHIAIFAASVGLASLESFPSATSARTAFIRRRVQLRLCSSAARCPTSCRSKRCGES